MKLDKHIQRLAAGDKNAFRPIYEATEKAVYYTALSILRERMLAEDAMQSAYLNVIKNASSYKDGTNAVAWIVKIARNEALNIKKRRSRETYIDAEENEFMLGVSDGADEYGALVDVARRNLESDEFQILMLVAMSGYKRREISEMLDMPIATVTWKYNQATQKMRALLNK